MVRCFHSSCNTGIFTKVVLEKVSISAKIELVERVRIKRLPDIYIWTKTWSREKIGVFGLPSKGQLQNDTDSLLTEFIAAYKSTNVSRPPVR